MSEDNKKPAPTSTAAATAPAVSAKKTEEYVTVEVIHGSLRRMTVDGRASHPSLRADAYDGTGEVRVEHFCAKMDGNRVVRKADILEMPLAEAQGLAEQGIVSFDGGPKAKLIYEEPGKFRSDKPQRAAQRG